MLNALRPLWDVDSSGWFVYGPDGRLAYVNRAFQHLTDTRPCIGTTALVPEVASESRLALTRSFQRLRTGEETSVSWIIPVVVEGVARPLQLSLAAFAEPPRPGSSVIGVVSPYLATPFGASAAHVERADFLEQVLGRVMAALAAVFPTGDTVHDFAAAELSERQREVLRLLLRGDRPSSVAATLHLSTHTVRNHVKAIFRKLGVHSQAELIALARSIQFHPSVRSLNGGLATPPVLDDRDAAG